MNGQKNIKKGMNNNKKILLIVNSKILN